MFVSTAYAQAAAAGSSSPDIMASLQQFAPIILIGVVFYFLMIRPQQRKAKQHKELISNLRRGDRVVTQGGLLGQVVKVLSDTEVQIELAENVRVRVLRSSIADVLAKPDPSAAKEPKEPRGRAAKEKAIEADPTTADEAEAASETDPRK